MTEALNLAGGPTALAPNRAAKPHFVALDGLRGVAAVMVLLCHRRSWVAFGLFWHGPLAVDFFFLLSGFVISYAYGEKLASGRMGFGGFVKARVLRLWPLVILAVMLDSIVLLISILHTPFPTSATVLERPTTLAALFSNLPLALLNLPAPWYVRPFVIDEPRWSLFYELIANLGFAAVAIHLTRNRLGIATALAFAALAWVIRHNGGDMSDVGLRLDNSGEGLVRVTAPFLLGVVIHRWWALGRLPHIRLPFWLLAAIVIVLLSLPQLSRGVEIAFAFACLMILFPLLIVAGCQATFTPRFTALAKVSAALSYPLYILHLPMLHALDLWRGSYPPHTRYSLLAYAIFCCLAALAVARFYDTPVRAWLGRRFATQLPPAQ